jgi:hypothetical protein
VLNISGIHIAKARLNKSHFLIQINVAFALIPALYSLLFALSSFLRSLIPDPIPALYSLLFALSSFLFSSVSDP